jgi:hypothetical protein
MDPTQFDRLVRALTRPASRRATLTMLLGGALASTRLATPTAAAAHRRHRRAKPAHPGNGDSPPGHGSTPPGHGGTPPGQGGTPPGQGGNPPGSGGCRANDQPCQQDDQCCSNHCVNGICSALLGGCAGSDACTTAAGSAGRCCAGRCCPSSCRCQSSLNGTFCYAPGALELCQKDGSCPRIVGTACQDGVCQPIDCRHDAAICPAGSQCTAGVNCLALCAAR